jgi:7,8-dihydropterin-6-yl-methyl-4-(beta-D-ribofuranosyl)aminobenzene 5'-phosphate synthase
MVWEIPTQVRATVLCANSVYDLDHVTAEHGWAVWLETSAGRFLSDTGPGRPLLPVPAASGSPSRTPGPILLSHHHGDQAGGLLDAMRSISR